MCNCNNKIENAASICYLDKLRQVIVITLETKYLIKRTSFFLIMLKHLSAGVLHLQILQRDQIIVN